MVTFHQAEPRAPRWPSTRESGLARCLAPSAVRAPVRAAVSMVPSTMPSGMPVGIVDGTLLTAARTGALTALGARYLARPDARVLGHLGARGSAWWNVTMLDDLFDFERSG